MPKAGHSASTEHSTETTEHSTGSWAARVTGTEPRAEDRADGNEEKIRPRSAVFLEEYVLKIRAGGALG
jgi:hypothetical protein